MKWNCVKNAILKIKIQIYVIDAYIEKLKADNKDKTPYWRTLKVSGELNAGYSNGIEVQKVKLEAEGHTIIRKGRKI